MKKRRYFEQISSNSETQSSEKKIFLGA